MIKKLFSHTFIYGFANQIPKIAGVFSLPFITKYLTEQDYGIFGVITSYIAAIEVLSSLGLRVILVNTFYKHPNWYTKIWREIYGFLMMWNIVYLFFKVLFLWIVMPKEVDNVPLVIFLNVGAGLFFGPTAMIGSTFFQIQQKPLSIAMRTAIFGSLTVLLNILFIAHLKLGYLGWFYSIFIVSVMGNASYFYPLFYKYKLNPIFKVSYKRIRTYLRVTLPTIPHYYSSFLLNTSDKIVMNQLSVPINDIGKYNAAYTVGNLFNSLGMVSGFAITPLMNECYKNKDEKGARELVFVLQAVFFLGSFIACLWLKEIFQILIKNEALAATYPLGIILVMGYNYRAMYYGAINKLFYLEKTKILWKITFVAGVTNIIMNFIAIPLFGYKAAAVTTFISLMFMGYSGYFLKDFKQNSTVNYYPIRWILITILLTIVCYLLRDITLFYKIGLSAVFLVVLVYLSWSVFVKKRHLKL
ncbi:oligosaccharide flippase family protein [Flavobacterium terrisoli]|uniref:oligosaccharide flippase family protein n=1 Tax=Flavobacterium terrisoli TaxID=3242195 RepID=UPI002543CCFE|nr:oligosaccharide flippase family protein [Flavobacterium buctense]